MINFMCQLYLDVSYTELMQIQGTHKLLDENFRGIEGIRDHMKLVLEFDNLQPAKYEDSFLEHSDAMKTPEPKIEEKTDRKRIDDNLKSLESVCDLF